MGIQGYQLKFLGLTSPSLILVSKNLCTAAAQHLHSNALRARLLLSPSRTRCYGNQTPPRCPRALSNNIPLDNTESTGGLCLWRLVPDT